MIHMFLLDGSHQIFKSSEVVSLNGPDDPKSDTMYVYPNGWIGYLSNIRYYKIITQHRIKEIHITREAGQKWT